MGGCVSVECSGWPLRHVQMLPSPRARELIRSVQHCAEFAGLEIALLQGGKSQCGHIAFLLEMVE